MYDEIIKSVDLTSDEVDLLITLLEPEINKCISVGAELTVRGLLDKLM